MDPLLRAIFLLYVGVSILLVPTVLGVAARVARIRPFRNRMLAQWKRALGLALLYLVSAVIASGFNSGQLAAQFIFAPALFCQSLLGLAFAVGVPGFDPLPVTNAVLPRKSDWLLQVALMVVLAAALVVPALVIGGIGMSMGRSAFHETAGTEQAMSYFPPGIAQAFFIFLSGAGLAEETTYRLLVMSFVWWLTRRGWVAGLVSALLFAAYHLSPLDSMYLIFWQFPVSQFLATFLIGLLMAFVYARRGYETAVLLHTFTDWLPFIVMAR